MGWGAPYAGANGAESAGSVASPRRSGRRRAAPIVNQPGCSLASAVSSFIEAHEVINLGQRQSALVLKRCRRRPYLSFALQDR